ncbi:MAG: plastocyanin/azurin family copper-binding protein [Thermoproteota archaeon]|nr:plastocyanin/azurin family copper-binding protein [Thermoproteota archaeon]
MAVIHENLSFTILVMAAMSLLTFGIAPQNTSATTSEIRMLADLNPPPSGVGMGAAADGRANYRERGNSMRLNVEVEDVSPNTTFTVEISENTLGTITTNSFGTAELELNTNDGQAVPKVLRGDLVEILQGPQLVLSGSFNEEVDDDTVITNQAPIAPAQNASAQAGDNSTATITSVITIPQDADDLGTGAYSPNHAPVSGGSTVTWNNVDSTPHTATADDGSFDTGIINGGSSGSALINTSTETRTIPYHCSVHPEMRGTLQIIPSSSLSAVPSGNNTLQDTSVTVTNGSSTSNTPTNSISSTNDTTIQNLQQQIVSLQQTVDAIQQTLMSLQQAAPQGGNVSISSDNNNSNTAETSTSVQEDLPQQQPAIPPILSSQQLPQSPQQQQGQQQQNQAVSIVPGSSTLAENAFQPNPVQVSIGATVTWTNDDSQPHTVTSGLSGQPDGRFDSSPNFNPLLNSGQTFEHTFTEAGEYPYFCQLHPNMIGTVQVN